VGGALIPIASARYWQSLFLCAVNCAVTQAHAPYRAGRNGHCVQSGFLPFLFGRVPFGSVASAFKTEWAAVMDASCSCSKSDFGYSRPSMYRLGFASARRPSDWADREYPLLIWGGCVRIICFWRSPVKSRTFVRKQRLLSLACLAPDEREKLPHPTLAAFFHLRFF